MQTNGIQDFVDAFTLSFLYIGSTMFGTISHTSLSLNLCTFRFANSICRPNWCYMQKVWKVSRKNKRQILHFSNLSWKNAFLQHSSSNVLENLVRPNEYLKNLQVFCCRKMQEFFCWQKKVKKKWIRQQAQGRICRWQ